jgi:hypothetical protein
MVGGWYLYPASSFRGSNWPPSPALGRREFRIELAAIDRIAKVRVEQVEQPPECQG